MRHWELADGRRIIAQVTSWNELQQKLDEVLQSRGRPKILTLGATDLEHFAQFGLSSSLCFLEFHPEVGATVSYVAREINRESMEADTTIWFDYAETPSEVPVEKCLPHSELMRALEEYVQSGAKPTCVDWVES